MTAIMVGKGARGNDLPITRQMQQEVWRQVIGKAERYNDPGRFTALIGYEYSSNPPMLHRDVVFRDGAETVGQTIPFAKQDSSDPAGVEPRHVDSTVRCDIKVDQRHHAEW